VPVRVSERDLTEREREREREREKHIFSTVTERRELLGRGASEKYYNYYYYYYYYYYYHSKI